MQRDRRLVLLILALILLGAAIVRLDRLPELTFFGGDEAREATVVRQMLATGQPVLLGTASSVGGFARGPAYYYLLAPALWLGGGDPAAGAIFVALADVVTVALLFVVGRRIAGTAAGLVAAILWAASTLTIGFARFMWNPQLVPVFELLAVYALARLREDDRFTLLLVPAVVVAWQLHDQALLLLPPIALFLLWQRPRIRPLVALAALGLGALTVAPFLVYEVTHDLVDLRGMIGVVLHGSGAATATGGPIDRVRAVLGVLPTLLPEGEHWRTSFTILALGGLGVAAVRAVRQRDAGSGLLVIWCLTALGYAWWPVSPSPHYLYVLFPLPFLAIGVAVAAVWRWQPPVAMAGGLIIALVCLATMGSVMEGLAMAQLRSGSLGTVKKVAATIAAGAAGRPFSLRLLSQSEGLDAYDEPYLYLLALRGTPPARQVDVPTWLVIDPATFGPGASAGGLDVSGVRVVAEGVPDLGPDLAVNGAFAPGSSGAPDGWGVPSWGRAAVVDGPDRSYLALDSPQASEGFNALQVVPVTPGMRYLVRFVARDRLRSGAVRIVAQIRDANGSVITPFPDGSGYPVSPTGSWETGSFFVDVPEAGQDMVLLLRNLGVGEADFSGVEVRQVVSPPVPGQAVH